MISIIDKHDDCLAKIPFIAVVGFILVVIGASISGGTLYKAFDETDYIFTTNFFAIQWYGIFSRLLYLEK